jgi:hypothetical protein
MPSLPSCPNVSKLVCCATAITAFAVAGCSGSTVQPVTGRVTYKGSPASGAAVYFHRQGGSSAKDPPIMGMVQEDGSFELVCGSLGKGAPPGDYDVLIEWRRGPAPGKGRAQLGPDRLKGLYYDRARPLLRATVEARTTNLPPFELFDTKPTAKPTAKR